MVAHCSVILRKPDKKTVLINADRGSSWRNIGGGRPAFSIPELAEIARNNQTIFEETTKEYDIHYCEIRYITFAHDEATYNDLERSCGWSNAYLIDKKDFQKEVSPYFNTNQNTYFSRHKSPSHCWPSYPGACVDFNTETKAKSGKVRFGKTHT